MAVLAAIESEDLIECVRRQLEMRVSWEEIANLFSLKYNHIGFPKADELIVNNNESQDSAQYFAFLKAYYKADQYFAITK